MQVIDKPKRPISGWAQFHDSEECNYLGFRGAEIAYSPDDFVVLILGDSLVEARGLSLDKIPERRLEHFLKGHRKNVKVFTLGAHGYGQDAQLLVLEEYYKKHRADLVLLFHSTLTDIEDNIFPVSGKNNTIKPTYWLEDGKLHGPTEGWLELVGPVLKWALLWNSHVGRPLGETRLKMWKEDILPAPYKPFTEYQGEFDNSWHEMWVKDPLEAFSGIEYERVGFSNQLTPRSELRSYGIDLTRKLFSEIKRVTESQGGHFTVFKEDKPWELEYLYEEKVYHMNGKYYKLSMKQYNDNLQDIYSGFEHYRIPLDMDNYQVSSEDQHLNQQAIDKLMKELSLIISEKKYFKEK